MAFPKLLQKLFQNDGAGDKLRSEILPDMNYLPTSGGTVSGSTIINQVSFPAGGNITTTSTSIELLLNYSQGGWLTLLGKDFNRADKGGFILGTTGPTLAGKPDGSLTWGGKPVLCGESGGFPVGFIALYSGNNVPNGWFRCDGSTVANMATNYPKLYAVLGTNVLPNYSGRFPMGVVSDINQIVAPGLPDISGSLTYVARGAWNAIVASGAFSAEQNKSETGNGDNKGYTNNVYFRASRSNDIYGASSTVQPPSVKCAFLIKHD